MILFATYTGLGGGAGSFLADVAAGFEEPVVVASPPGAVAEGCRERGVAVIELEERPLAFRGAPRSALAATAALSAHGRDIRRLARELEPDAICTWGMRSSLAVAMTPGASAGARWVARHHDFLPRGAAGAAVRRAHGRADAVVANSRAVADELDLGRATEVILPGVDLERFSPAAGPPAGPPLAVWLGAFVAWKRPDLALEVAGRLPRIRLRMGGEPLPGRAGGDGDLLERARARAERANLAGRVELPGRIDPAGALAEAHLLLHTADREPFGIAIAEALACGVPVVAPASGGPAEAVDASCGRLFEPGNAAAAAAAVEEVLAEREALSAGARRRAGQLFDLEAARERFRAVIRPGRRLPAVEAHPPGSGMALVTVSHDSAPELGALLRSAARHLPGAHIVVADSGSTDDSAAVARHHGADVVQLENVGYGVAANAGLERVREPVTVVANPDVELIDGSLAALAVEIERDGTSERLLAPRVLLPDGRRQDVAQHEPATARMLAFALVPPTLLPSRVRPALEPWRSTVPTRAAWAVGACIAGRTETLRRLGPFDPGAFMYAEDLDLGLRAADAGIETWYWPAARVIHRRAHAARRVFGGEPFELLARRRREVISERRGRLRLAVDDALQALTFANRLALKRIARRPADRERRQLAALREARRA